MDVAFAVWNGDNGDRNGEKSVSALVRMAIDEETYEASGPVSGSSASSTTIILMFVGVVVVVIAAAIVTTRGQDGEGHDGPEVSEG